MQTINYTIQTRDGPARIGNLQINNHTIRTPAIAFLTTKQHPAPPYAELTITTTPTTTKAPNLLINQYNPLLRAIKDLPIKTITPSKNQNQKTPIYHIIPPQKKIINQLKHQPPNQIYIIATTKPLFQNQSQFIDTIIYLKEKLGPQNLLYLPSIGTPTTMAFLTYLGIDIFDSTAAITAARNNTLLLPTGPKKLTTLTELPCNCPICIHTTPSKMTFQTTLKHNYHALISEIKLIRQTIQNNNLRELIEIRAATIPHLSALLRLLDLKHNTYLEKQTTLHRKQTLQATTKNALHRPEIQRFQHRLLTRYKKPPTTKILLVLPCSAKKPYSFSKTHKLFTQQLIQTINPHIIHEVIITSPLGIVPRELETIYPASNYDIGVTGIWDEDEKQMIRTLLAKYLNINNYDHIVLHIPQEMQEFISELTPNAEITCTTQPTSEKSLTQLNKTLKKITKLYPKISKQQRTLQNITGIASYQFGPEIAEKLLKKTEIKGKYPYLRITYKNNQLGMTTKERGYISLTLKGAEIIAHHHEYWIEIFNDFTLKGSVFAPGIKNADENIRIGDEVVLLQKNQLKGVGIALMNGEEMKQVNYGEAVKTRHIC